MSLNERIMEMRKTNDKQCHFYKTMNDWGILEEKYFMFIFIFEKECASDTSRKKCVFL